MWEGEATDCLNYYTDLLVMFDLCVLASDEYGLGSYPVKSMDDQTGQVVILF